LGASRRNGNDQHKEWATPRTVSARVNKSDSGAGVVFGYGTLSFYIDNQELHLWDGGIYNSPGTFDTGASLPCWQLVSGRFRAGKCLPEPQVSLSIQRLLRERAKF
jgi:hypothetical protein